MFKKIVSVGAMIVGVALLWGCSGDNSQNLNNATVKDKSFSVSIALPPGEKDSISRAEVVVSGDNMDTIYCNLTVASTRVYGTVQNIPLGLSRHIEIKVFDKNNIMTYYGDAYADIVSDKTIDVTITMKCLRGSINVIGVITDSTKELAQDAHTLALYHFNEPSTDTLLDETERYNGTLVSGTRCAGLFGNGLSFTSGQYAIFPYDSIIPDGTPEGTVECYFSMNADWNSTGSYAIFGNNGARCLLIYKNGQLIFLKNQSNIFKSVAGTASLQPNHWYHLAGTWGGKGMRIFLNDSCIGSNTDYTAYQSSPRGISENTFYIGMKTYDGMEGVGISSISYFDGKIDEVRISDIARY